MSGVSAWGQGAPEPRIGDAEREGAAWALGEHYSAGRITHEEFEERAAVAWQARSHSQLAPLFRDLPLPHGRAAPTSSGDSRPGAQASAHGRHGRRVPFMPLLFLFIGLWVLFDSPLPALALVILGLWLWNAARARMRRSGPGVRQGTGRSG